MAGHLKHFPAGLNTLYRILMNKNIIFIWPSEHIECTMQMTKSPLNIRLFV